MIELISLMIALLILAAVVKIFGDPPDDLQ